MWELAAVISEAGSIKKTPMNVPSPEQVLTVFPPVKTAAPKHNPAMPGALPDIHGRAVYALPIQLVAAGLSIRKTTAAR